jgi:hypothetical protein
MSYNMNMIFTVRMISALLGAAACILGRVALAPAAPAEPIRNIVLGGEGALRMVLVTKDGSGQSAALK